jgi:twinkle protein
MVRALAVRDRCKIIVIDPWNEMEHLPEKGESMTSYINFALKTIRGWAKALEIHVMIVAHPAKTRNDGSKPRAPTGYDIADSAAFFNKPGLGITVHPAEQDFQVQIINWKTRDALLYGTQKGIVLAEFAQSWGCYRGLQETIDQAALDFSEQRSF